MSESGAHNAGEQDQEVADLSDLFIDTIDSRADGQQ
jgi:hypothetical protein